jgi:hypothetical protein
LDISALLASAGAALISGGLAYAGVVRTQKTTIATTLVEVKTLTKANKELVESQIAGVKEVLKATTEALAGVVKVQIQGLEDANRIRYQALQDGWDTCRRREKEAREDHEARLRALE